MDTVADNLAQELRFARQCLLKEPKDIDAVLARIDSRLEEYEFFKTNVTDLQTIQS